MRHIVEEVEAGAAGTEQHGVAASGEGCRRPDAVRHVVRVGNGNAVFGSEGIKGFVTDAIAAKAPEFDRFYTCGPLPMMKAVCTALECGGEASLEERMGCGAGFCYGCSCHTLTGTKRICKDGPVFDKEDIIWQ